MTAPALPNQIHLSGMDAHAVQLANKYQCGYEITAFSYAPMLEDAAAFSRVEAECEEIGLLWLHAPFAELIPCAIDPNVRANAMSRFRQTRRWPRGSACGGSSSTAGLSRMSTSRSGTSSSRFASERVFGRRAGRSASRGGKRDGAGSEMLVEIARGVDDPRLGLCLDVGHANTVVSKTPPADWPRTDAAGSAARPPARQTTARWTNICRSALEQSTLRRSSPRSRRTRYHHHIRKSGHSAVAAISASERLALRKAAP